MSMDWHDAAYEEGMSLLYEKFKQQYKEESFGERIDSYYTEHSDMIKTPLRNLHESELLFRQAHYDSALLQAAISIEVGIKAVILKPIFYAFAVDNEAAELIWGLTFRRASLTQIPNDYYRFMGFDLKEIFRKNMEKNLLTEIKWVQDLRNGILHQGQSAEKVDAETGIAIAKGIYSEVIPDTLDGLQYHIDGDRILRGSRKTVNMLKNYRRRS